MNERLNISGWVLLPLLLVCAPLGRAQEPTLALSAATETVVAGEPFSAWLCAFNASSNPVAWTFPARLNQELTATQGHFNGTLILRATEAPAVIIAPGTFVRREYSTTLPTNILGQVVMKLPGQNVNRVVLDAQAAPTPAPATMATIAGTNSLFSRLVMEVEPEEAGKEFDPGRFFKEHISGYEPMYFIAGTKSPNAKFQISFAYQLLNQNGPLATRMPALKGFHFAYTQTSLWDWNAPSAPFYDTSYKPELFYAWDNVTRGETTNWLQLDLQGALKHESNGQDGADSRSVNIAYLRPTLTLGRDDGLQLILQPRVWTYLGDLSDNPDIAQYRGYADMRAILGWKRGLQLSALGRMGRNGNHHGLQLDLTYPTMRFFGSFSVYLDLQYFTGYGESLLGYNQKSEEFRIGFALYR